MPSPAANTSSPPTMTSTITTITTTITSITTTPAYDEEEATDEQEELAQDRRGMPGLAISSTIRCRRGIGSTEHSGG